MSKSRIGRSLVPMVALAALLSGCGGAVTDAPTSAGEAARVGDESISHAKVNDTAEGICAGLEAEFADRGQVVPMLNIKQLALSLLAARSQLEQIADEYDVEPGPEVQTDRLEWERSAQAVPEELREGYVDVRNTESLLTSILTQAGEVALAREGIRNPTQEEVMGRGSELFDTWTDSNDLETDPRYSMVFLDGELQPGDRNASVAVSDRAVEGMLQMLEPEEADPTVPASLPESQRCG